MKGLIAAALIMIPVIVYAEPELPFVPSCIIQDSIGIRDEGPDKAIVTYYNSVENCSSAFDIKLIAPNGIGARVRVIIGGEEVDYKEVITVEPLDPNFMSFPPEVEVLDGEKTEIVIMGGLV